MNNLGISINILLIIAGLWSLVWKVYAVWIAVENNKKRWFVALLILNTLGILEIIYIFNIEKKTWADVFELKNDFVKALFRKK